MPTAARCCPGCTTIICTCGRWRPHSTLWRSGRRTSERKRNWRRPCGRPSQGRTAGSVPSGTTPRSPVSSTAQQLDAARRRHSAADPAPQRCDVDPELGGADPRRTGRSSGRQAAQRRRLVGCVAAPGDSARRHHPPARRLRRHRNHRCHTGPHRRRHRDVVGGPSPRRDPAAAALPCAGQADPARRPARRRRAHRLGGRPPR